MLIIFELFFIHSKINSQNSNDLKTEIIKKQLIDNGQKNVVCLIEDSLLIVSFENYRYRFDPDAINNSIRIIASVIEPIEIFKSISIVIQKRMIPIIVVRISQKALFDYFQKVINENEFRNSIEVSSSAQYEWNMIKQMNVENSSVSILELTTKPQIRFQFGDYDFPVKWEVSLLPSISTTLAKGLSLRYELFLVAAKSHFVDKFDYLRTNTFTLSQLFKTPLNCYGNFSIGYFTQNRYGLDFELGKYLLNENFFFLINSGFTGHAAYLKSGMKGVYADTVSQATIEYTSLNYFSYITSLTWFWKRFNLSATVSYGKYLYNQNVAEFSISRRFEEYDFGIKSFFVGGEFNFGFNFTLPLYPYKYLRNKKVLIKPNDSFSYSYLATNIYVYKYETGNNLTKFLNNLNPKYVENQVKHIRE